jgi:hypothetical protein
MTSQDQSLTCHMSGRNSTAFSGCCPGKTSSRLASLRGKFPVSFVQSRMTMDWRHRKYTSTIFPVYAFRSTFDRQAVPSTASWRITTGISVWNIRTSQQWRSRVSFWDTASSYTTKASSPPNPNTWIPLSSRWLKLSCILILWRGRMSIPK